MNYVIFSLRSLNCWWQAAQSHFYVKVTLRQRKHLIHTDLRLYRIPRLPRFLCSTIAICKEKGWMDSSVCAWKNCPWRPWWSANVYFPFKSEFAVRPLAVISYSSLFCLLSMSLQVPCFHRVTMEDPLQFHWSAGVYPAQTQDTSVGHTYHSQNMQTQYKKPISLNQQSNPGVYRHGVQSANSPSCPQWKIQTTNSCFTDSSRDAVGSVPAFESWHWSQSCQFDPLSTHCHRNQLPTLFEQCICLCVCTMGHGRSMINSWQERLSSSLCWVCIVYLFQTTWTSESSGALHDRVEVISQGEKCSRSAILSPCRQMERMRNFKINDKRVICFSSKSSSTGVETCLIHPFKVLCRLSWHLKYLLSAVPICTNIQTKCTYWELSRKQFLCAWKKHFEFSFFSKSEKKCPGGRGVRISTLDSGCEPLKLHQVGHAGIYFQHLTGSTWLPLIAIIFHSSYFSHADIYFFASLNSALCWK